MTNESISVQLGDEYDNKEKDELLEENIDIKNVCENNDLEDNIPFFSIRNEIESIIKEQMNTLHNGVCETNCTNSGTEYQLVKHMNSEIFPKLRKESTEGSAIPAENLQQNILQNLINLYNVTDNDMNVNNENRKTLNFCNKALQQSKDSIEYDIPLFIKDILQLKIDNDAKIFTAFNIKFRTVLVYGIIYKQYTRTFILDDGTGSILIKYSNEKIYPIISKLRNDLNNKILSAQVTKNKSEIELTSSLDRLLKQVEEQINITQNIKNGSKVFVLGKPCISKNSEIFLQVYDFKLDSNRNCDKELFFKRDLIRYYTSYYHKGKKIGDGDDKR